MLGRNEESAWQRASASLDATAKIYGYRVDSVHTETFKFLGGLNRNKKEMNIKEENEDESQFDGDNTKKKEKIRRGVNTLETNIRKLNLDKYDIDTEVDPLFSVMTSKFNESTAKGLLLNTIPLDDKINYILESKKPDENPECDINNKIQDNKIVEEKNIKKEENISSLDTESLKDNISQSDSEASKLKDALILNNNLQKKEKKQDNNDMIKNIPVTCSKSFESVEDSIKDVLKTFIKSNNIDDFIHLQICPELSIFRQSRNLNIEGANISFINAFKDEINYADKKRKQINEENPSIIDEEEPENFIEMEENEGLGDIPDDNFNNQENIDNMSNPYNNNELEENNNEINYANNNNNFNLKLNENNFSLFKYEDLIERAGQFGTGNTDNLPHFTDFAKNFGKLDKNSFFNKGSILGIKKEGGARKKKEEKNFIFDEEEEIDVNELFNENRSKLINKGEKYDFSQKRKVKCYYHFDKLSQFKLFTITAKTITSKDIDNDLDINQQEKNLEELGDRVGEMPGDGDWGDAENQNDIVGFEKNNEYDNFYQNEKKAEKNFGRLYRKFDIRALKKKIWTSYDDIKEEQIDFKNVVMNMSKGMNDDELFSISTPTCFVCMLHLCNEKNLFIEQKNMNTFFIDRDSDGIKSEEISKGKNFVKNEKSYSDSDE
jgi:organic hydroperoxide reductase OsmC/OhrA